MSTHVLHKSSHNVDPKIWGPQVWSTIHNAALSADASNRYDDFEVFIRGLSTLLPCEICREDFLIYLKKNAVTSPCFDWSVALHNHVNKKLGKNEVSVETARSSFSFDLCTHECTKSKSSQTSQNEAFIIIAIIAILWILQFARTKLLSSSKA
jgi:hypothetical protein